MKKYTGTIILGLLTIGFVYLAFIFGIDTILSFGDHATISEWVHNWLISDPQSNIPKIIIPAVTLISGIIYLIYHFLWFKPKK